MHIAVLGAGAFGTSLAKLLEARGHDVTLWCRGEEAARRIQTARESPRLPGARLGERVACTHDLAAAVADKPMVLVVTPSHGVRAVLTAAAPHLSSEAIVVVASKGIEEGSLATMDQVCRDVLPPAIGDRASFLSGPTFAKELAAGLPAAIVVASHQPASCAAVQDTLASERLRVYSTEDVIGVELGGALKNVVAIGAGIADGLGYGHNTRAALITRGLNEIARLGARMGAHPLTFLGLAGMGDLVLTCTGDLSRNRQVGLELGKGRSIADILAGMTAVAEGVRTAKGAYELAAKLGVELPIATAIYAVLYEGKGAKEAVMDLMRRESKSERG
jgi:glycerol-3-phosphate dehydrogenase (NAD(P)+)